ncbi:MAG: hypothetical protein KKB03_01265 [Nanoarchaeota archaeon]|nr:hypothetical protein [Nanoarchaeota archaeon]MBU1135226.1 hypothetical protein [Nanoarchaeota archaeon]MBU2519857.1 hypothetical protein [Nanoarchaeota archaeon]
MNKKIAVIFPTGRKTVHNVVAMLVDNMGRYKNDPKNVNVYVSFDPTFYNLSPDDFMFDKDLEKAFRSVTYLGPGDDGGLSEHTKKNITDHAYDILFKPRGYCTLKNRATVNAIMDGNDAIMLFDDDEYFVAPKRKGNGLEWMHQNVFGYHMDNIFEADITNGAHTGYFSPVPSEIENELEKGLREKLGRILSYGSEIINEKTFMNTRECINYADNNFLKNSPYPVEEVNGIKFLTGGNIALNVQSILSGKIPPYFNPKGARGEDAIMGMQLKNSLVLKIPTYTFHDPFQKYVDITKGKFPESVDPIAVIPGTVDRFANAVVGWVKYAPFLIRMTSSSEDEYRGRINAMKSELGDVGKEMSKVLSNNSLAMLGGILDEADEKSYSDLEDLNIAKNAWEKIIKNI